MPKCCEICNYKIINIISLFVPLVCQFSAANGNFPTMQLISDASHCTCCDFSVKDGMDTISMHSCSKAYSADKTLSHLKKKTTKNAVWQTKVTYLFWLFTSVTIQWLSARHLFIYYSVHFNCIFQVTPWHWKDDRLSVCALLCWLLCVDSRTRNKKHWLKPLGIFRGNQFCLAARSKCYRVLTSLPNTHEKTFSLWILMAHEYWQVIYVEWFFFPFRLWLQLFNN